MKWNALVTARNYRQQRVQIDIDLAGRPDVTDLETVGLEAIFHQADLLDTDHFLPGIWNDEAGRRRPDLTGVGKGEIAALVDVAAGDQPQVDGAQHFDQPA